MDKDTFIQRLKLLLIHLDDLTSQYCFNSLSTNYKFLIEPSERATSKHLTDVENSYLVTWNKLENKSISFDQVIDQLFRDNKTTKWADCSIYHSSTNLTIVHIIFSRQFREDNEIYYVDRGTGPFKAVVAIPPDHLKVEKESKFDINWRKHLNDRNSDIFTRFRKLFC